MNTLPTEAIIEETVTKLGEEWDLDEDFPRVDEEFAGGFDTVRSMVTHTWIALSEILEQRKLPALTTCWDANADGQMDGWAMQVTFYTPREQYSLGAWGDDGDVTMDDSAEGPASARAMVENAVHHYEILFDKGVRLGIYGERPEQTVYTLQVLSYSSDLGPSVTAHLSLADLGDRLLEEWMPDRKIEFTDDADGIDGLIQLIGAEHMGVEFLWDSHVL